MPCHIKATPYHTRSSKRLLELCVHTLQGFGDRFYSYLPWVIFIQDAAQTPDLHLLCNFLYSVLAAFRNAEKGRCLRAAQPDPGERASRHRAWHSCSGQAGEHGATCCGCKRRALRPLAPPRYVPGLSAGCSRPVCGVRDRLRLPPTCASACARLAGAAAPRSPRSLRGPSSQCAFRWGLGCPHQMLSAAGCSLWDRNYRGL